MMLSQFYAPIVGGEERHVQDLSAELVKRGHQVTVVAFAYPDAPAFEIDQGVRIFRIQSSMRRAKWLFQENERHHAPPFPDPEALWAIRTILQREQPDIVHAHNWLFYSFIPLKMWCKASVVVTLHDYSLACAKKRRMHNNAPCSGPQLAKCISCAAQHYGWAKGVVTALSNEAMGAATKAMVDMFLPVSRATAEGNLLTEYHLPFQVIPNFIPARDSASVESARLESLPSGDFLLFVGDLSAEKGIYTLLQAYEKLEEAPPLVLIGRTCGDTPTTFPKGVIPLGIRPNAEVLEAMRLSSVVLVPSIWPEPFGIVAIEAMSVGKPVIASRIGGLSDIVLDGVTGLLVHANNSKMLGQAIQLLIGDPELRMRMGVAAMQRTTEYSASVVVPKIEQVYYSVLETLHAFEKSRHLGDDDTGYTHG